MLFRLALAVLLAATLSAQSDSPRDALFAALHTGSARDVERILKSGVNPNAVDADGTPAVMAATLFGNAEIVQLLVARGANPDQPDAAGLTALMWAVPDLAKARA